jgi:hypothetical protein
VELIIALERNTASAAGTDFDFRNGCKPNAKFATTIAFALQAKQD